MDRRRSQHRCPESHALRSRFTHRQFPDGVRKKSAAGRVADRDATGARKPSMSVAHSHVAIPWSIHSQSRRWHMIHPKVPITLEEATHGNSGEQSYSLNDRRNDHVDGLLKWRRIKTGNLS